MRRPDKTEKALRFGCGFTFGLVAGFFAAFRLVMSTWGELAALAFASAFICGLLAMKYGNAFWHSLKDWW
jgi:hypothetical protein